jgi:hypothetical protein
MKLTISETSISHDAFFLKPAFSTYISLFFCLGYIAALVLDLCLEADFEVQYRMLAINLKGCTKIHVTTDRQFLVGAVSSSCSPFE